MYKNVGWTTIVSGEHKPVTGVWGQIPHGIQGQSPWSGGEGQSPPEAERFLAFGCAIKVANLPQFLYFGISLQSPCSGEQSPCSRKVLSLDLEHPDERQKLLLFGIQWVSFLSNFSSNLDNSRDPPQRCLGMLCPRD